MIPSCGQMLAGLIPVAFMRGMWQVQSRLFWQTLPTCPGSIFFLLDTEDTAALATSLP
jgi:hypothetical protein